MIRYRIVFKNFISNFICSKIECLFFFLLGGDFFRLLAFFLLRNNEVKFGFVFLVWQPLRALQRGSMRRDNILYLNFGVSWLESRYVNGVNFHRTAKTIREYAGIKKDQIEGKDL